MLELCSSCGDLIQDTPIISNGNGSGSLRPFSIMALLVAARAVATAYVGDHPWRVPLVVDSLHSKLIEIYIRFFHP